MTRPPVRWADTDLPEELSRLIASAAPVRQDDAALARVRERLHHSLGPTFESRLSGANHVSRALSVSVLRRAKWLCAAALATAGLSFLSMQSLQTASRFDARPPRLQPSAAKVVVQPASDEATGAASLQPTAATSQLSTATLPVVDAPRAPAGRASGARMSAIGNGPERRPQQVAKTSAGRERGVANKIDNHAATSGEQAGLAAELRGLAEIRKLLETSPTRALALAESQETLFMHGALGPERELLRIEALLRADRADEAKRRAAHALSASNNSPYRARIEKLFAQTPAPRLAADGVAKQVTHE